MPPDNAPSVRYRRIGRTLRELRENAALTLSTAGRLLDRSPASLSMIENGLQSVRPRDLAHILDFYKIPEGPYRDALLHLADAGRKKSWIQTYEGRVSPAGLDVASLEEGAGSIRCFELYLIPGLLQTEDYIRAVMCAGPPSTTHEVNGLVNFRLARQRILARSNPPRLTTILGEAALYQQIGGDVVMRAQLEYLVEAAALQHVTIRVLPFSAGAQPGLDGRFNMVDLRPPGQMTVAIIEDLTQIAFREREEEVAPFVRAFDQLATTAWDESVSLSFIKRLLSDS